MTASVKPQSWVTCVCGKVCKGRAAHANHGRKCPVESARAAAFVAAIERGEDAVAASREAVKRMVEG